ncbi:MAG: cytochrome C biogenesis protein [Methylophilales bacterium RIFCSPHIGHO2_02_FULL_57_10]|nr:MAG: cytochrome C biogenesis protein [Methylophilales bacterium RIFCSPHIGHO2_02_FULL_57_10]
MKRWFSALLLIVPLMAVAGEAQPLADDPAMEARLKALSQELRCLVCQNQTLADSSAPLAEDLRREIRELIAKGMTDKEITDYLVVRYGDFVRYRPPLKTQTALLWGGPFLLLAMGLVALALVLRNRNRLMKDLPDEDDEEDAA